VGGVRDAAACEMRWRAWCGGVRDAVACVVRWRARCGGVRDAVACEMRWRARCGGVRVIRSNARRAGTSRGWLCKPPCKRERFPSDHANRIVAALVGRDTNGPSSAFHIRRHESAGRPEGPLATRSLDPERLGVKGFGRSCGRCARVVLACGSAANRSGLWISRTVFPWIRISPWISRQGRLGTGFCQCPSAE